MGHLRIESNGIRVEGDSEFLRGLYASSIRSQKVRMTVYILVYVLFVLCILVV